jgi:hypothetical protein
MNTVAMTSQTRGNSSVPRTDAAMTAHDMTPGSA